MNVGLHYETSPVYLHTKPVIFSQLGINSCIGMFMLIWWTDSRMLGPGARLPFVWQLAIFVLWQRPEFSWYASDSNSTSPDFLYGYFDCSFTKELCLSVSSLLCNCMHPSKMLARMPVTFSPLQCVTSCGMQASEKFYFWWFWAVAISDSYFKQIYKQIAVTAGIEMADQFCLMGAVKIILLSDPPTLVYSDSSSVKKCCHQQVNSSLK